jgi:hypothetical protein
MALIDVKHCVHAVDLMQPQLPEIPDATGVSTRSHRESVDCEQNDLTVTTILERYQQAFKEEAKKKNPLDR